MLYHLSYIVFFYKKSFFSSQNSGNTGSGGHIEIWADIQRWEWFGLTQLKKEYCGKKPKWHKISYFIQMNVKGIERCADTWIFSK